MRHLYRHNFGTEWFYGIVHGRNFGPIDTVFFNNRLPGKVTYRNDMVGPIHSVFLNGKNRRIDIAPAAVEIGCMDMYHQRFSRNLLGVYPGWIRQPVVRVYDVAGIGASYHTGHNRIIIYLFEQIVGITPRKFDTTQIIGMQIIEIGVNVISQIEIFLRIHAVPQPAGDIVPRDIAPCDRCISRTDDMSETFIFISVRFGYDECYIHIAAFGHTFCKAVARRT